MTRWSVEIRHPDPQALVNFIQRQAFVSSEVQARAAAIVMLNRAPGGSIAVGLEHCVNEKFVLTKKEKNA